MFEDNMNLLQFLIEQQSVFSRHAASSLVSIIPNFFNDNIR